MLDRWLTLPANFRQAFGLGGGAGFGGVDGVDDGGGGVEVCVLAVELVDDGC